jgi:hypothetical protein
LLLNHLAEAESDRVLTQRGVNRHH